MPGPPILPARVLAAIQCSSGRLHPSAASRRALRKKSPTTSIAAPLARIELRLDPEKPLNEEKQMAEHWEELQAAPPPGTGRLRGSAG